MQYAEPADLVQRICNNQPPIIKLQKEITDLKSKQFLPPKCNHTEKETQIRTMLDKWDKMRRGPTAPAMEVDLRQALAEMTRDAPEPVMETCSLRTQWGNALTVAARLAPAAHQALEDRGQKFPNSPDFAGSDHT